MAAIMGGMGRSRNGSQCRVHRGTDHQCREARYDAPLARPSSDSGELRHRQEHPSRKPRAPAGTYAPCPGSDLGARTGGHKHRSRPRRDRGRDHTSSGTRRALALARGRPRRNRGRLDRRPCARARAGRRRPRSRPRWQQRSTRLIAGNPFGGKGLPGRFPRRPRPCRSVPAHRRHAERRSVQLLRQLRGRYRAPPDCRHSPPGHRLEDEAGEYSAKPARVFRFEEIAEAHRVMESSDALGKLVVEVA